MDQRQQEMFPNNFPGPMDGMSNGVPESGERMHNGPSSTSANSNINRSSLSSLLSKAMENQKPPGWQLDLMMEKLRQKSKQLKPLAETAKNIRMALQERRQILDQVDRVHLQKNLDVLQQSIKVNSLQSMVERLEMVSRQLGLKFTPGSNGNEWFISSDMFYLELLIDQYGQVKKVQIQHDGRSEQQNVPEMVDCLCRNDFTDFTAHLEGLVAIYQLNVNADKKIKNKAFIALQAMEADLAAVASTYGDWTDGEAVVMKSKLGLLQPRKGGHAVKLVYFISPYDFLDTDGKTTLPNEVQTVIEKKLGCVANVSIQASTSRKLQMSTTVSLHRRSDGRMEPKYSVLNATNSTVLPACFVINLAKPMPICKEVLNAIQTNTTIPSFDMTDSKPLLGLITRHFSNGSMDSTNNRGLFVALPDTPDTLQVHCYFMTENVGLDGIVVSSINFTLASQLPNVISLLRQQALFNSLISTCIRVGCKPEMDCMVFEISALSHQNISVSFQHPLEDSLVTLEFDLKDVAHPMCRLHAVSNFADIKPTLEEHACRVVQRSLSIPVTVRAVIRRWQSLKSKHEPPAGFTLPVGGSYGAERFSQPGSDLSCGTASEKVQNQQQQQQSSQHSMVPGMVMGISNDASLIPVTSARGNVLSGTRQFNGSSYTISPVPSANPVIGMNIPPLGGMNAADLMASFSNSFMQSQAGGGAANFLNLASYQNLLDVNQSLASFIDQGQRGKRRKRKGTNDSNTTSPVGSNASVTRPSPSPSPKSPRAFGGNSKSPKRRPSEGSDISDTSQGADGSRSATPLTPRSAMDSNSAPANMRLSGIATNADIDPWAVQLTPFLGPIGRNDGSADMEIDMIDGVSGGKKVFKRKEFPKRSVSLDSNNSGGNIEEVAANLHSLVNTGATGSDSMGSLVTPSVSITPVSQNSGPSTVNSLLAAIRPGIQIIPLPLPSSITCTAIPPKPGSQQQPNSQETKRIMPSAMKIEDVGDTGTTLKKKLSTSSLPDMKKERKRKASSSIPPLLDEDGMVVHDMSSVKQPKLSGPFSMNTNASLFPSLEKKNSAPSGVVGGSAMTVFKASSPPFKLGQQKPGSPNLLKSPLSKVSSPGPKIGGKPSVYALKSATGSSPKVDKSGKIVKEKKNNGNKIVKSLSLGNPLPVPNLMPALKSLSDSAGGPAGLNLATLHPGLIGLSSGGSGKFDPAMAEQMLKAASLISKAMEANKQQQMQIQSAVTTAAPTQTTTTSNGTKPQVSSSSTAGPLSSKKGNSINAIINKLSSQLSKDDTSKTNEGGKMDYQKVSSAITNDVQQRKQAGGGNGNNNATTPTSTGGAFVGNNQQEYTVKTGGNSGLKMKLSISKSSIKDKAKAGLNKLMGIKKPPTTGGQKPTLGSPQSTKSFPGASTPPGKKNGGNNGKPDSSEKKSKNGNGNNSNTTTKPSSEERMELAKTLFKPGAASKDTLKFDVTKYQIPKKSSSSQGSEKEKDTSPKSSAMESPQSKQSDRDTPTKEIEKSYFKPKEPLRSESPSSNSCPPVLPSFVESKPAEKIKLSSAAVSDMPFLQEMNSKVFINSPTSVGSPMNLSQSFRASSYNNNSNIQEPEDKKQNDKPPVLERAVPKVDSTSPESPDPANIPHDDNIYKNTKTIPTAPIVPLPVPLVPDANDTSDPSSPSGDDEDKLVIDMREKGPKEADKEQQQQQQPVSSTSAADSSTSEVENNSKETFVVPPPPPPEPVSSTTNSSSSSNSNNGSSRPLGSPAASASSSSVTESKEVSTSSVTSPLPATVSVHIVHSPQPNSPAFQRSPLVVQSPHSAHASPYPVDDDLMDEVVTGK